MARIGRTVLAALFLVSAGFPLRAEVRIAQETTTPLVRSFTPPLALPDGQELTIQGMNGGSRPVTLILRMDDGGSVNYRTRFNVERVVPPGPFVFRFPTSGLRTSSGKSLNAQDIRKILVGVADNDPQLMLASLTIANPLPLHHATVALDFGSADSAVFPGFTLTTTNDPRLEGRRLKAIRRPGPDALIGDGIIGLEGVRLSLAPGRWRLGLWTEDPGEWEYLPHPLDRRIAVNGIPIHHVKLSDQEWLDRHYFAGSQKEALIDGDPWAVFGAKRGGLITTEITVPPSGLVHVKLEGDWGAAYLGALLAEPVEADGLVQVESLRRARFLETWRVTAPEPVVSKGLSFAFRHTEPMQRAAPGTSLFLEVTATTDHRIEDVRIEGDAPSLDGKSLSQRIWAGHWQFERPNAAATLLRATPSRLRSADANLPLVPGYPRRYVIEVGVPEHAASGRYHAQLRLRAGEVTQFLSFSIDVLPVRLPQVTKPIGVYLESAPHLDWFASMRGLRRQAIACDMRFLRALGLTGVAPPLITPTEDHQDDFLSDVALAEAAGFSHPFLAYAPVKRLYQTAKELAPKLTAQANERSAVLGAQALLWSIADEPSNPGILNQKVEDVSTQLRAVNKNLRLAGHLNNREDRKLLRHLDVALVNAAFGVDKIDMADVRRAGVAPWFYNLDNPRAAAGFYFWKAGADGYLQWHGRAPTAAPFDPTDGREADVQLLYPMRRPCASLPDMHEDLMRLAQGIVDLRWMLWLEQESVRSPAARNIFSHISKAIPETWDAMKAKDDSQFDEWRRAIQALAAEKAPFVAK